MAGKSDKKKAAGCRRGCAVVIFGFFVLLVIGMLVPDSPTPIAPDSSAPNKSARTPESAPVPAAQQLQYEVVERNDVSYAGTPRMAYRVVLKVDQIPDEQPMKDVAVRIWEDGNQDWAEFSVFLYLPGMNTAWSAYGIGKFRRTGLLEFTVNEASLFDTKWAR